MKRWLIFLLASMAVVLGVFFATKQYYENENLARVEYVEVPVEKIVEVPVETKTAITAEVVEGQLRDVGELASEEYAYREVATFDSTKSVQIFGHELSLPLTQSRFIYSYEGTIRAGIDFAQIDAEVDESTKQIRVILPASRILSSELDETSFELYDEQNNIFNPFSVKDVNETNRALKENAERRALDGGLLERADANARTMVRSLLQNAWDLGEYLITVETANE